MISDLLNSYDTIFVITKSTTSFIFTFLGLALFVSTLLVTIACISAHSKAKSVNNSRGTKMSLAICLVSVILGLISITQTGLVKKHAIQDARLKELCKTAKLEVYETVTLVESDNIYIDQDYTVQFGGNYGSFGSLGNIFFKNIGSYIVKNPEFTPDNGLQYLRVWKNSKEQLNEIKPDFSILTTNISSKEDKSIGIHGYEVMVINNRTNNKLAHFRYFWNAHNERKFCPSTNNKLLPTQTIMYVFDMDMNEKVKNIILEGLTE